MSRDTEWSNMSEFDYTEEKLSVQAAALVWAKGQPTDKKKLRISLEFCFREGVHCMSS